LVELVYQHNLATNEVVGLTEKWEIIDPRVSIFRPALHVRKKELLLAQLAYDAHALTAMPNDLAAGPFWIAPDQHRLDDLKARTDALVEALWNVGMCVSDYRTEMQNALLKELFEPNKAPVRKPEDPKYRPIELDRSDELLAYFEEHEHWARPRIR
jgi:hypothetical protein